VCSVSLLTQIFVPEEVAVQDGFSRKVRRSEADDELSVQRRHRIAPLADLIVLRGILQRRQRLGGVGLNLKVV